MARNDNDKFDIELDVNDLADCIEAVKAWELEYEKERLYIKEMLDFDFDDVSVAEEHREEFEKWVESVRKKLKRRWDKLANLAPERSERASILKVKLIYARRDRISKVTDRLCEPDAS